MDEKVCLQNENQAIAVTYPGYQMVALTDDNNKVPDPFSRVYRVGIQRVCCTNG